MRTAVFIGLALVMLFGTVLLNLSDISLPTPNEMSNWLNSLGIWGPMAVIGLMVLHSFVPFPAELLAVCAGAVFGTVLGAALVWVGAMLGGSAAFFLSRVLGRDAVRNWLSIGQVIVLDRWTNDQGVKMLLMSRLIPIISFNIVNYAVGLTRVRVWTFLWTMGIGILPVTLLSTYMGSQMKTLDWPALLAVSVVAIVVMLLARSVVWAMFAGMIAAAVVPFIAAV